MNNTFDNFLMWWKQPFRADASALSWIMFTGFILIVIALWMRVLDEVNLGIPD